MRILELRVLSQRRKNAKEIYIDMTENELAKIIVDVELIKHGITRIVSNL